MNLYCISVKSKNNINEQCSNKPKNGQLCGVHLGCKHLILFKILENAINTVNMINTVNEQIDPINNSFSNIFDTHMISETNGSIIHSMPNMLEESIKEPIKEIYEKDVLFEKILTNKIMSIFTLRKSIKHCKLDNMINTNVSKQILITNIKKYISLERYYLANEHKIIMIQSIFRTRNILKRTTCVNDMDIISYTSKYDIPNKFFYIFYDNISNRTYAYDIRSLLEIIKSEYPSCPYTFRKFTDEEKEKIMSYCYTLYDKGININMEKPPLSPEEDLEMKMKDVFHKINMLDNYANYIWFKNLELNELINLYIKCEDMWNFRLAMTIESKTKIVNDGQAFVIPLGIIKNIKSKFKLRHVLLDDFYRFVTEGIDRDERKLGAILILSALVEVSNSAAYALPHLVM
jgi:hypothetical protein